MTVVYSSYSRIPFSSNFGSLFPCIASILLMQFLSLTGIWSSFGVNPKPKTNVLQVIKFDEQTDRHRRTDTQADR